MLPLRWYRGPIDGDDFDALLACADRRVGRTLYRPSCPSCQECKGIRVPIAEFSLSRSQRRVWKKNQDLQIYSGYPVVDKTHLDLFNRHKLERGLSDRPTSESHYKNWLAVTCTRTVEMRYVLDGRLIGVGILDLGRRDASSVYFYFEPTLEKRSLGVFSVLAEIEWLRSQGYRYYYLGLYVRDCAQLSYKARYKPHERLEGERWVRYG